MTPHVVVVSHERSGTHLTIDTLRHHFDGLAAPYVNLDRVRKVCTHMNGEYHLQLEGGATAKMSRTYKDKVRHFF